MESWASGERPVATLAQMMPGELAARLEREPDAPAVLDVRSDDEWTSGHIAGAKHLFAGAIAQGTMPPFDRDEPIALICGSGYRSTVAASFMETRGFTRLTNIIGGMSAWTDSGLPATTLNTATPAEPVAAH
jgi:hydroxyacylglutathione hydrolase